MVLIDLSTCTRNLRWQFISHPDLATINLVIVNFQFQFFNAFLALFYIAFFIRDMDRLKTVSSVTIHKDFFSDQPYTRILIVEGVRLYCDVA